MKNKRMFARLMSVSLSLAMVITAVPVKAANEFISYQGNMNQAGEKARTGETESKEFRSRDGHQNTAKKKVNEEKKERGNENFKDKRGKETSSRYSVNKKEDFTYLRWEEDSGNYKYAKLEINFNTKKSDGSSFGVSDAEELFNKGKIQVNDGRIWTLRKAKFMKGVSPQSFICLNSGFIKEFVNEDDFGIKIIDQYGDVITVGIQNGLSDEEREKCENLESKETPSSYVIEKEVSASKLEWKGKEVKYAEFSLKFKSEKKDKKAFDKKDTDELLEYGEVQINNGKIWSFKDAGFKKGEGSEVSFTSKDTDFIKSFIDQNPLKIRLIDQDGNIAEAEITNTLSKEERQAFKESLKKENKDDAKESKYLINKGAYFTRLAWEAYSEPKHAKFELAFQTTNKDGSIFNGADADEFISKAMIQINDGKNWSFKKAGIERYGSSATSFISTSSDFIKEFVDADELKIKVTDPAGFITEGSVKNGLTKEERDAFKESIKEAPKPEEEPGETENTGELKIEFGDNGTALYNRYGTLVFDISFKSGSGSGMQTKPAFPKSEEAEFAKTTKIEINKQKFGTMGDVGFEGKASFEGSNFFRLETEENLRKIKSVINDSGLNVKLITKDYGTIKFYVKNGLTDDEREKITGQKVPLKEVPEDGGTPSTPENPIAEDGVIKTAEVALVKSKAYDTPSMAGPTMKEKAEIITDAKGNNKLILHFAPAVINGITAYSIGLDLTSTGKVLGKDEKGDIKTDFIMRGDNSAICIVDIPKGDEDIVYEGHIYSSVMDNPLALKISKITKTGDIKTALKKLVQKAENDLGAKVYYPQTKKVLETAIKKAKESKNYFESYVEVVKAMAGLREKLDNPFKDGNLFFIPVESTSTIASPASGEKALQKWGRVVKNGEKTKLTVIYASYKDYEGRIAFKNVEVIGKDETKIPAKYDFDSKEFIGVLSFDMPYTPEGGIFKTKLTDLTGKVWDADLILDYSKIHKGMLPELLAEAIEKYDRYKKDDFSSYGKISEDREADFTKLSWSNYINTLNKCKDDLKPENRANLTQEIIDEDISSLKKAKEGLVYKIMSGKGKTANLKTAGIGNPDNYYNDDIEHATEVGWAGSKIKFGGKTYKVLNNGLMYDRELKEDVETGKLLVMADDFTVKKPWVETAQSTVIRWDKTHIRSYLNNAFYNKFNATEKSLILETDLKTVDTKDTGFGISKLPGEEISTKDKVFVADVDVMRSVAFGFASRDARDTGLYYMTRNLLESNLGGYNILAVKPLGRMSGLNRNDDFTVSVDVFPMMNLDKSNIIMTLADSADVNGLNKVSKTESNVWKPVIKDSTIKAPTASVSGKKVTANGTDLYAAIVKGDINKGEVKYFGKVKNTFDLPEFKKGEDKLYIFSSKAGQNEIVVSEPVEVAVGETNNETELANGTYTLDARMLAKNTTNVSMSNVMFAQKVDVKVKGDNAELKLYAVYPVPAFPDLGKDGTLKNFYLEYAGKKYMGESDLTTKPLKEAKETNEFFKLVKGEKLPMQVITVKLPKAAIAKDTKIGAGCYVNVVMNSDVKLDIEFTNLTLVEKEKTDIKISYKYKSITVGKELPTELKAPAEETIKYDGTVSLKNITKPHKVSDGQWVFKGWKDGEKLVSGTVKGIKEAKTYVGEWAFEKKKDNVELANGAYTLDAKMLMKNSTNASMANVMFAEKVDVKVKGDNAELKLYAVYPVPAFPTLGKDGTLKNFYLEYAGKQYMGESDITTKPLREVKENNPGFGLVKGEKLPMQVITIKLPKAAIAKDTKLGAGCYVNVVMNSDVKLDIEFTNLTVVEEEKSDIKISYKYKSITVGKELPTELKAPAEETIKYDGTVSLKNITTAHKVSDGQWVFKGWKDGDKSVSGTVKGIKETKTYVGEWAFEKAEAAGDDSGNNSGSNSGIGGGNVFIEPLSSGTEKKDNSTNETSTERKETDNKINKIEDEETPLSADVKENKVKTKTFKFSTKTNKAGLTKLDNKLLKKVLAFSKKNSNSYVVVLNVNSSNKEKADIYISQDILNKLSKTSCKLIKIKSRQGEISIDKKTISKLAKNNKGLNIVLSREKGNYKFAVINHKNKTIDISKLGIKVKFN